MVINENEVHLWHIFYEKIKTANILAEYHRLLSREEKEQLGKFYFQRHQHRYLVTRAALRTVLSSYERGISPSKWVFDRSSHGKPAIANLSLSIPLRFNLSHTEKLIVVGVTLENDIGVDAEYTDDERKTIDIARRFFSEVEVDELLQLPSEKQRTRFFDLWTLKEAYVKARGMGLSIPLDRFHFRFPGNEQIEFSVDANLNDPPELWRFWLIRPGDSHRISVALRSTVGTVPHALSMYEITPLVSAKKIDRQIERCSDRYVSKGQKTSD